MNRISKPVQSVQNDTGIQGVLDSEKYGISYATLRNWEKLNSASSERLTKRANKRKSKKRVIPLEYFSNKTNVTFVIDILDYIDKTNASIESVIFSLGVSLLNKTGIYCKKHVQKVLNDYSDIATIKNLLSVDLPDDEYDILGLIYQSYLQEGKKNIIGSYYTPRKIALNMTESFSFSNSETFFDPCCGSGAFLLALSAKDPSQIYGTDNDPIAVMIAKINLLVKYADCEFFPQVYDVDYLMGYTLFQQNPIFKMKFDYIATNPPWGAMKNDYSAICEISSKETFSYFFVEAYKQLKKDGTIRFLFPEAILNVKTHKDIRKYILDVAGLVSITIYNDMFTGVTTKYVDIKCGNGANTKCFTFNFEGKSNNIELNTIYETENLVFNLLSDDDVAIVRIVKEKGRYNLQNSVWALGVVTGDNKNKLFADCQEGMEKIYTGKDIQPFTLTPAKNYIVYDRNCLQQVAKEDIYRADEKLVYKFISNKLVFAYDNSASLFLNSANILIPNIPSMSMKTVLAFLNSLLFQFMYIKLFGEVKVLKGNLTELPFPEISSEENDMLTSLVDGILDGDVAKKQTIDDYIFALYGLNDNQISFVRRTVYGKTD